MLLDAVIIVLREVLEAALIISILLASNRLYRVSHHWIFMAVASGIAFSILLATQIGHISMMFDGAGQEFAHFLLLVLTIACLLIHTLKLLFDSTENWSRKQWTIPLSSAVALAICREGEEIFVYGYAFASHSESKFHIVLGAAIGAGIGISIGVLAYYGLSALKRNQLANVIVGLLTLICSGMAMQAVMNLMQAGAIESQLPLWNSSSLVAESSMVGQLLFALFAYESTPTCAQVGAYITVIALVSCAAFASRRQRAHASVHSQSTAHRF